MDTLTLTVRLYDPREKQDAKKASAWMVIEVPRDDLKLSAADFSAKWLVPSAEHILQALQR